MPAFIPTFPSAFTATKAPSQCRLVKRQAVRRTPVAKLEAVLFDCDGVLADTERDAHRVAFNLAFAERNLPDEWGEALYGKLLAVGGGKERMTAYWNGQSAWPEGLDGDAEGQQELVRALHKRKTALFMELVDAGKVPLRPGVKRLVRELNGGGVRIGVCSTSNEKAVRKIVDMLGEEGGGIEVFAGDVVEKKKPAPDIYLLAKREMGLGGGVVVVEDSFIGVCAAREAGMPVVVTKSTYTGGEDFGRAQMVVDSLEEPRVGIRELEGVLGGGVRRMRRMYGSSYL